MGKLAMWGAVAGGAEGYQTELANREKREAAAIDEQRQERLLKMQQAHSEKMAGRREEHEKALQKTRGEQAVTQIGAQGENQLAVVDATMGGRGELQDDQQAFLTIENQLDRESREKIAAASRSAAAIKAAKRFEAKILSVGEANEYGIKIETDAPGVYDKESGTWFLQKGDKLVLPESTPPEGGYARANQTHVDNLYKNPDRVLEFVSKFGYAPIGVLSLLNRAAQPAAVE